MQQSHVTDTRLNKTQNIEVVLENAQRDIFTRYYTCGETYPTFDSRATEKG